MPGSPWSLHWPALLQGAFGHLHRDNEVVAADPGAEEGEQVGVVQAADHFEGLQLDLGRRPAEADELQGHVEAAGSGGLPDLAEAALAQLLEQLVFRQRPVPRRQP